MPTPTPGLMLDYLALLHNAARIVRVYGDTPCITLPEALPAPACGVDTAAAHGMGGADAHEAASPGGASPREAAAPDSASSHEAAAPDSASPHEAAAPDSASVREAAAPDGAVRRKMLPVRELGAYCFAQTPRALPPSSALLHCRVEPDGRVTPCDAAGQTFAPPRADAETSCTPICGALLEELTLPDTLETLGSCAFYNCRALKRLSLGGGISTYGSDVFLNAFALSEAVLRAAPGDVTCLYKLVNNLQSELRVLFWPETAAAPTAALWYPEYWEDIEETPAHILLHTFSGQGYHYRQCFLNGSVLFGEYDAVFPQSRAEDPPATMALLCLDRLRRPYQLADHAAAQYKAFLSSNFIPCVQRLLKAQDTEALAALLALEVLDGDALTEAAALAARAGNAEAAALIANAEQRFFAAHAPKKKSYSFDDF